MEKIKVLIVEDKSLVAQSIAATLKTHSLEVVAICDSGEEALKIIAEQKPDLILMDIELVGAMDGISTAQMIQKDFWIPVIYLSDFKDPKTVDRAKKTLPANYLTKPFNESDLIRAIDIAFTNANAQYAMRLPIENKDCVLIRTDSQTYIKLNIGEILYLEADRSYCNIVTENTTHTLSTSMNHIHEQIKHPDFLRVHRSFVVNLQKVKGLHGNVIQLSGGKNVQMSKEFRDSFMERQKIIK